MTFLNPLDTLIPKIPFSFFADFWVWVTSEAQGSVSVGFWGSRQLSPFWWGGSSQGAPSIPPQLCLYVSDFNRPCTHWVFKPMDPSKPNLVWPSGASDQSSTGRE